MHELKGMQVANHRQMQKKCDVVQRDRHLSHRRWKLEVSRCHRSTNDDKRPRLPVSIEHTIKGLSPVPVTSLSMAGTCLPKLCTFLR
ncbi:hypothetical protein GmHk_10G029469 [Glycine max]|nr:hypothetical protein GmHk_10G029469 [Glycine max]